VRVAVIGVGGVGSAACRFLAQAGHTVTGFEQFTIGHERGSSHGASRIIRKTYPDPYFTALMQEAYPLWEDLEREAQESTPLFTRTGILYLGPNEHPEIVGVRESLAQNDVAFETLRAPEIQARYPVFRIDAEKGEVAIYQEDGGILNASAIVSANVRLAVQHGAQIRENCKIERITNDKTGVTITTNADTKQSETFDRVIVTAGAWISELFPDVALPLTITRQTLAYFAPGNPAAFAHLPVWIDAATHWYGFPHDSQIPGVKIAHHQGIVATDADHITPIDNTDIAVIQHAAQTRFHGLTSACTHAKTCLYTNTPDEDFIFLQPKDCPNILGISACSGHGFKFTILNGKLAADWATGKDDLSRISRFVQR
jgi:sarcosine oxidase